MRPTTYAVAAAIGFLGWASLALVVSLIGPVLAAT
jgi:hypothetical protein